MCGFGVSLRVYQYFWGALALTENRIESSEVQRPVFRCKCHYLGDFLHGERG